MNEKRESPSFSILTHENGTKTLVDLENSQAMHSRIGPADEAKLLYADLAQVEASLINAKSEVTLYDVGMGTSANALAVLNRILSHPEACGILRIFSFETKPDGLRVALAAGEDFPLLDPWRIQLEELLEKGEVHFKVAGVQVQWQLLIGDFYENFPRLPTPNVVFFDFYSPKIVPELWTRKRLQDLKKHFGDKKCRSFTYVAATPVRIDLLLAGFSVGRGGSTQMKNESTVFATHFEDLKNPLRAEWLANKLKTSKAVAEHPDLRELEAHPQFN